MIFTDDPIADFNAYDREQQEKLDKLPCCSMCKNPIQDDSAYYINDEWVCSDCISNFLRSVDVD